jgi:F420-non-reducing hydrogenase iron-sulfur subunit
MNNVDTKIRLFCCATSYDQAEITRNINQPGVEIKVVLIPCSGKLDILYLTKAFETGADGAAVMICREGECRYLEGNMRAKKRVEAVETLLEETGLGQGRIAFIQMKDDGVSEAMRELDEFCKKIKKSNHNAPGSATKKQ